MKCSPIWALLLIALVACLAFIPFDKPWPYPLKAQILASLQQDSSRRNTDEAAFAFSCIGDYGQALRFNDKNTIPQWTLKGFIKHADTLAIQHSKPVPAQEYIIQRAQSEQLVIINEAHHNPPHRVFTASLLKGLYQAGFRYLAAETLYASDSTLNQRGYPLIGSGYYTREPTRSLPVVKTGKLPKPATWKRS
ncbi:hypothetical protein [Spirosoma pollinicola]|uniref:Uncharacterized protein n=1 Tax=Spirosoma pollinicola TaxID=2057025 RepID=A0A2K8Z868_9BACT|nr:hypothetical protein [Spirosoma pollinicola]AUD06073.1 hypothetical protein CWM47_32050 [Spirosoma pollinicola]